MPTSRRAQVLLEPEEYARLEQLAEQQQCSVSARIRTAVRQRCFPSAPDRQAIVDELLALRVPMPEDWRQFARLIEDARAGELR